MTIPTQKEWVEGCLAYYKENDYQPGNPEDGVWQECHYPVPKCLGGTETILLLREHHAVQGVLQSEEFQHPCIWTWEAKFLSGEFLSLCKKWEGEKAKRALAALTPEERSERVRKANETRGEEKRREIARKANASKTPEQRSEGARKANAALTPEERQQRSRKGGLMAAAAQTPEQRRARGLKAADAQTPEQLREARLKAWETRRKRVGWEDEKQRKARARKTHGKPVEVFTPWGVLLTFASVIEAEEALGIYKGGLVGVLTKGRKHAKGFVARYS